MIHYCKRWAYDHCRCGEKKQTPKKVEMMWQEIVDMPMSDGERRLQRAILRADEASIRSIRAKDPQAAYDYDVRQWCRDALTNPLARFMPCAQPPVREEVK